MIISTSYLRKHGMGNPVTCPVGYVWTDADGCQVPDPFNVNQNVPNTWNTYTAPMGASVTNNGAVVVAAQTPPTSWMDVVATNLNKFLALPFCDTPPAPIVNALGMDPNSDPTWQTRRNDFISKCGANKLSPQTEGIVSNVPVSYAVPSPQQVQQSIVNSNAGNGGGGVVATPNIVPVNTNVSSNVSSPTSVTNLANGGTNAITTDSNVVPSFQSVLGVPLPTGVLTGSAILGIPNWALIGIGIVGMLFMFKGK